jgi:hypothetical protein
MRDEPLPEPVPKPGELVAWRHPRLASALGRFHAYGPGPFEVVRVLGAGPGTPTAFVVKTPSGERTIEAAWLGPVRVPPRGDAPAAGPLAPSAPAESRPEAAAPREEDAGPREGIPPRS